MSARSGWDPEAPHPSLKEAHRWTRAAAGAGKRLPDRHHHARSWAWIEARAC